MTFGKLRVPYTLRPPGEAVPTGTLRIAPAFPGAVAVERAARQKRAARRFLVRPPQDRGVSSAAER